MGPSFVWVVVGRVAVVRASTSLCVGAAHRLRLPLRASRYFDEDEHREVPHSTKADVLKKEMEADEILNRRGQARV